MSFILDALKKVDAKKRFGNEAAAGELARSSAARARRGRELLLIGSVAVGSAALTAGVLVLLSMRSSPASPPEPTEAPPPAASVPLPDAVPAPPSAQEVAPEPLKREVPSAVERASRAEATVPRKRPVESAESAEPPESLDAVEVEPPVDDAPPPEVRIVGRPAAAEVTPAPVPNPPAPAPPAPRLELVLQGTSVLDGRPVAVISDRRVFEGDFIEGARVLRIEERSVTLERDGERFSLTF